MDVDTGQSVLSVVNMYHINIRQYYICDDDLWGQPDIPRLLPRVGGIVSSGTDNQGVSNDPMQMKHLAETSLAIKPLTVDTIIDGHKIPAHSSANAGDAGIHLALERMWIFNVGLFSLSL